MNTDDRIEDMIRSCVDHEVRDVELPAGLAERIIGGAERGRGPKRLPFSMSMAALATATAVVVAPVSFQLLFDDAPAPDTAVLAPRALEGRVTVTVLPPQTETARPPEGPEQTEEDGRSTWTIAYSLDQSPRGYVWIRVVSGDITLQDAAIGHSSPSHLSGLVSVPVSRGEAKAWTRGGLQNVVFQPEPGLVIVVRTLNISREEAVRIAEGVRVR